MKTGLWVGDCFIYTSSVNRLNYYVGGEIVTIAHLDRYKYRQFSFKWSYGIIEDCEHFMYDFKN